MPLGRRLCVSHIGLEEREALNLNLSMGTRAKKKAESEVEAYKLPLKDFTEDPDSVNASHRLVILPNKNPPLFLTAFTTTCVQKSL